MQKYHHGIALSLGFFMLVSAAFAEPYDPHVGTAIDTFLSGRGSPIAGNGSVYFSSGVTYNVDPRLINAIAGAESSFGTNWAACPPSGFNAWSWFYSRDGICANSPFTSFADGIRRVTSGIRRLYLNNNLNTIPLIARTYCAEGCASWIPAVTQYYTQLGGETSDLTFARTLIDFEQFTGPCCFTGIQPPLTVGIATFSGGQILGATSNLPADRSPVYGTAFFCPGCLPTLTINFSQKISNFSTFLLNGQLFTVTYTVQDDQGGSQTVSLVANLLSGAGTVMLSDSNITQVTITSNAGTEWDFFIDNVQFAPH